MAKNHNAYCPKCGSKLWFSQAEKTYRCPNPSCERSPNNDFVKAEKVAEEAEEEAKALKT